MASRPHLLVVRAAPDLPRTHADAYGLGALAEFCLLGADSSPDWKHNVALQKAGAARPAALARTSPRSSTQIRLAPAGLAGWARQPVEPTWPAQPRTAYAFAAVRPGCSRPG